MRINGWSLFLGGALVLASDAEGSLSLSADASICWGNEVCSGVSTSGVSYASVTGGYFSEAAHLIFDASATASMDYGRIDGSLFLSAGSLDYTQHEAKISGSFSDEVTVRGRSGAGSVVYAATVLRFLPPDPPHGDLGPHDAMVLRHNSQVVDLQKPSYSSYDYYSDPQPIEFGSPFAVSGSFLFALRFDGAPPGFPYVEDVRVGITPAFFLDGNGDLLTNGYTVASESGRMFPTRRGVIDDFDGDDATDPALYLPGSGTWQVKHSASSGADAPVQWGTGLMIPLAADYDGDSRADFAAYQPSRGLWFILYANQSQQTVQFGAIGMLPVPGDYDGDAKIDLAVYTRSTGRWFVRSSRTGQVATFQWGSPQAIPVPADYDGDSRFDVAVYVPRKATWYIKKSSDGQLLEGSGIAWGPGGSIPVQGDYDGDHICDLATFNPPDGTWRVRASTFGELLTGAPIGWGWQGAVPVPGDYDSDGFLDLAVFSPVDGLWYIRSSVHGALFGGAPVAWGTSGAVPATLSYPLWKAYRLVR